MSLEEVDGDEPGIAPNGKESCNVIRAPSPHLPHVALQGTGGVW